MPYLSDAMDDMLIWTREIREFVQALAETSGLTHDQWADLQQLEHGTNELLSSVWAAHTVPEQVNMEAFAMQCRTALNTILGFTQVFLEGIHGDLSGHYYGSFMQISERAELILGLIQQLSVEFYADHHDLP